MDDAQVTLTAQLKALAADRDAELEVEPIDGDWRAGFVVKNALDGEAILLSVNGPDRETAMRRLLELAENET